MITDAIVQVYCIRDICFSVYDITEEELENTRKLKIYSKSQGNEQVPQIILQGKWLEHYGFTEGTFIAVECDDGKLIITPREPDPEESGNNLEARISNMTKAQKKQLSQVLDDMGIE